jgi:SAM-dependent methyltransferase
VWHRPAGDSECSATGGEAAVGGDDVVAVQAPRSRTNGSARAPSTSGEPVIPTKTAAATSRLDLAVRRHLGSCVRSGVVPDPIFAEPRLAAVYDALESERSDLAHYVAMVEEFGARQLLDVGCGTGSLAVMLATRGYDVTAVDPAEASLAVARQKPGAERVRWLAGDATTLPPMAVDLAVMTGNVAQVFLTDGEWSATLTGIHAALRRGGRLAFESRDPERDAWRAWTRDQSLRRVEVANVGVVASWVELLDLQAQLVSFRWTYVFEFDGVVLTSDSTLRFRSQPELTASLTQHGFLIDEIREAPDRPGQEFVFLARRAD